VTLARGGLPFALKVLADRNAVPVELDVRVDRRLPEHIEVAAYFAVSEALTNATKHASASVIRVEATIEDGGPPCSGSPSATMGVVEPALGAALVCSGSQTASRHSVAEFISTAQMGRVPACVWSSRCWLDTQHRPVMH
jgi:two-component sensor histidine kinase